MQVGGRRKCYQGCGVHQLPSWGVVGTSERGQSWIGCVSKLGCYQYVGRADLLGRQGETAILAYQDMAFWELWSGKVTFAGARLGNRCQEPAIGMLEIN